MSSDQPASLRDLSVEDQDTIEDVTAFYLDAVEEDYIEEPEENGPAYLAAIDLYHRLTGAWRDRGANVYSKPNWLP